APSIHRTTSPTLRSTRLRSTAARRGGGSWTLNAPAPGAAGGNRAVGSALSRRQAGTAELRGQALTLCLVVRKSQRRRVAAVPRTDGLLVGTRCGSVNGSWKAPHGGPNLTWTTHYNRL